jgi:hypothetical protein
VEQLVTGRSRLPAGAPRKASQRRSRPGQAVSFRFAPSWRPGDKIRWHDKSGVFARDLGDEHAEVRIDDRIYRVQISDLKSG